MSTNVTIEENLAPVAGADAANNIQKVKGDYIQSNDYTSEPLFDDGTAAAIAVEAAPVAISYLEAFKNNAVDEVYVLLLNTDVAPTSGVTAVNQANGDRVLFLPTEKGAVGIKAHELVHGQLYFDTGLYVCYSTDPATYTAYASFADMKLQVEKS